jgi:DNA-binding MarR family transcriptional regulator
MNVKRQLNVAEYVGNQLGIPTTVRSWTNKSLPPIIQDAYLFSEMAVGNKTLLLLCVRPEVRVTPKNVAAHIRWFAQKFGKEAVYVAPAMSAYDRKQLVGAQVPFIVPGSQIYLPALGTVLSNRIPAQIKFGEHLGAVAQLLVLAHLLGRDENLNTATALAARYGYTNMYVGQAIKELEARKLVEVRQVGHEKRVRFLHEGRKLWETAKPYLRTPVKRRIFLNQRPQIAGCPAGLSLLATQTALVEPEREVLAFGIREWRTMDQAKFPPTVTEENRDGARYEIEIWSYDPILLGNEMMVDPFSLFLSMDGTQDERVEAALKKLLETTLETDITSPPAQAS